MAGGPHTETIRLVRQDEFPEFMTTCFTAFGSHLRESDTAAHEPVFEPERCFGAFEGGRMVATSGAMSLELTLPGLSCVPAAGVSWVGVLPTHRRRGILRALMARQLEHACAEGLSVAILGASEGGIYRRFGFGPATSTAMLSIPRALVSFAGHARQPGGRVRLVDQETAHPLFFEVYDRARRTLPGRVSRSAAYWNHLFKDAHGQKEEAGPPFLVVHDDLSDIADGYAIYRVKEKWVGHMVLSELMVDEVVAATATAYAELWRYLLHLDLIATVTIEKASVDEPLRWLLTDGRHLRTTAVADDLWVRLLDVPVALAARSYRAPGALMLEVEDAFVPRAGGRYRLSADEDRASAERSTGAPDLTLDAAALGSAYLGGVAFSTLAAAGLVREDRPGAVERADRMFATAPAPFNGTDF